MGEEPQPLLHRVTVEFITRPGSRTARFNTAEEARAFVEEHTQDRDAYHIFCVTCDAAGATRSIELSIYRAPDTGEWQACAGQRGLK